MDNETNNWVKIAMSAAFALLGGIVREATHSKTVNLVQFFWGGVVGAFSGVVVYFLCQQYHLGDNMVAALTGLAGYAGAPLLNFMSTLAQKFIERTFK